MEQFAIFTNSRGILKSCASHNRTPRSSSPEIDDDILRNHRAGGSIYVCTEALQSFVQYFLPQVNEPFVLVSGDSDLAVSEELLATPSLSVLLNHPLLLRWYAQNLMAVRDKLFGLPIGMDYHTMWERPGQWGISSLPPLSQENLLIEKLSRSPAFNVRYVNAYCNWHFFIGRGDRRECHEQVDGSICFFEPNPLPRDCTWSRQSDFMYVLSPAGVGQDCHRTWEALLLGSVPIVRRSPIAALFETLPVLIVDEWADVRRERLLEFSQDMVNKTFDFNPLFRDHWVRVISGINPTKLPLMSFSDFRSIITRRNG